MYVTVSELYLFFNIWDYTYSIECISLATIYATHMAIGIHIHMLMLSRAQSWIVRSCMFNS
jgi:hypothetical protein